MNLHKKHIGDIRCSGWLKYPDPYTAHVMTLRTVKMSPAIPDIRLFEA